MKKKKPLKIKTNSKTFEQFDCELNNLWIPNKTDMTGEFQIQDMTELLDNIFKYIEGNDIEVTKIMLPSLKDKKLLDGVHKLASKDKRFYLLLPEVEYNKNKKELKPLAGKVLMRFSKTEIPFLILASTEKGVVGFSKELFIQLTPDQIEEANQWFFWIYNNEASFEIADEIQLEKPKKNGLHLSIDPIYPSFSESFKFMNELEEEQYVPSHALISDHKVVKMLGKDIPNKVLLNGIEEYTSSNFLDSNIVGTKGKIQLPSLIWYRKGVLLLDRYGDRWLKIWCGGEQKDIIEYLRDITKYPYKYVRSVVLGDLEPGTDVFIDGKWEKVRDKQEIKIDPIKLESILTYDEMDNEEPKNFPPRPMPTKEINFTWDVHPPYLPSDAKKHELNGEWDEYQKNMEEVIKEYITKVDQIIKKADSNQKILGRIKDKLSGQKTRGENYFKKLNIYEKTDWKTRNNDEKVLKDLFEDIDSQWDDLDKTIKSEEFRLEEEEQKRKYEENIENTRKKLYEIEEKIKTLKESSENDEEQQNDKEIKKLENEKQKLTSKIDKPFVFKKPKNIFPKGSKKTKKKSQIDYYRSKEVPLPEKPAQPLPVHGLLFKNKQNNFLAISNWNDVTKAKKEAKRYNDAKVVSYPNKGEIK